MTKTCIVVFFTFISLCWALCDTSRGQCPSPDDVSLFQMRVGAYAQEVKQSHEQQGSEEASDQTAALQEVNQSHERYSSKKAFDQAAALQAELGERSHGRFALKQSGKCLQPQGGKTDDGTPMVLTACTELPFEYIIPSKWWHNPDYFYLRHVPTGKCVHQIAGSWPFGLVLYTGCDLTDTVGVREYRQFKWDGTRLRSIIYPWNDYGKFEVVEAEKCLTPPAPTVGYDLADATQTLTSAGMYIVTGVKCAPGFTGPPVATCASTGLAYTLENCKEDIPYDIFPDGPGCSSDTDITSPAHCRAAAHNLGFSIRNGQPTTAAGIHSGSWTHAPKGCLVGIVDGRWDHLYFNTISGDVGRSVYQSICLKASSQLLPDTPYQLLANGPGCSPNAEIKGPNECKSAAKYFGLSIRNIRPTMVAGVHSGSWTHAPKGCLVGIEDGRWDHLYFNTISGDVGKSVYQSICLETA